MDADQLKREWEAREQALFECAQRAWAARGGYELHGWHLSNMDAIVAYGTPPRAKWEYHHVFLFRKQNYKSTHLVAIGKAPWHKNIRWQGETFENKRHHVQSYPIGKWIVEKKEIEHG
jgi:hypothetical protein